jgi:hypothetical protein
LAIYREEEICEILQLEIKTLGRHYDQVRDSWLINFIPRDTPREIISAQHNKNNQKETPMEDMIDWKGYKITLLKEINGYENICLPAEAQSLIKNLTHDPVMEDSRWIVYKKNDQHHRLVKFATTALVSLFILYKSRSLIL